MSRHTVIITGATKGLGRELALVFAASGSRVLGLFSSDTVAAAKLEIELAAKSDDSIVIRHNAASESADLWSRPEIQDAANLVLINNANGPFTPQPFHLLRWHDFESGLNVGLRGAWQCSRAVLKPMLRAGHGTIVNVLTSAVHGLPPKGFAAYATAKHAQRGLTLALAAEYKDKGLRVFSASPGFMRTSLTSAWDPRLVDAITASGAVSDPADAAQKIRALVDSPETVGRGEDYLV
jgi:3-oxoacyl-[acyl-carrier protein] reductase